MHLAVRIDTSILPAPTLANNRDSWLLSDE